MATSCKGLTYSDFKKWTEDEADRVIVFLEGTNPDILRQFEELERTTQDISGPVGENLGRAISSVYPEIASYDRLGLIVAVRRRIWAKVTAALR